MKIAISCTGEGYGHAARVVALTQLLRSRYDVAVFCPSHIFPFIRENVDDPKLYDIPYFSFVKRRQRIDYPGTALKTLPQALRFPVDVARIARRFRRLGIEALISDYDPYCTYAADGLGMPILQINHPSIVMRQREFSLESWTARIVSILLMGKYHKKLVVSFYDGDVGPVVRPALENMHRARENFFVVYLKPSYRKMMLRALRRLAITNIQVFPDPQKNIIDYLARCRGVISSAGHQFMSEALVLNKPVFVVPQVGQYEQLLNARMLEASGWGTWSTMDDIDRKLREFVDNIDQYPLPPSGQPRRYILKNDLPNVVNKIDRFLLESQQKRSDDTRRVGAAQGRSRRAVQNET